MNTQTRKIGIVLLFVILLPAVIFSIYQLATLSESEKIIENIYSNQLDALLFSINQYSEDVTSRIQQRLNSISQQTDSSSIDERLKFFQEENSYINKIIFIDSTLESDDIEISNLLKTNSDKLNRLYGFKKEKYSRIEPIEYNGSEFLFFILDKPAEKNLCGLMIDPNAFINEVLSPKILSIAQDELSIFVFNTEKVYNFNSNDNTNPRTLNQQRKLWLFPNYYLAIKLRGETIEDLVARRTKTNMILVISLILLLISGVWFVFRNIKREVELVQIKSEFVSNVSHELRTPLSLISMFAETLEMGRVRSEEKRKEYYSIISNEAARLSKIVNKILSFSKMEAGKRKFTFEEVELNDLVEKVFESYKFHLQNNNFEFNFNKHGSVLKVRADSEALSEAVINLIDNAVKYSNQTKHVELFTRETEDFVFVGVKDYGIGIAEEHQKKIFEKFYRVQSGLVHNTKGTGLGLSLVKQIMDAHKGEIALTSKAGHGSTFCLKFRK